MGETAVVMQEYLGDAYRFADLFNVVFFQGEQVIEPQMLSEQSERYTVHPPEPQGSRYHVPDTGGGGAKLCGLYNASSLHGI